ncbi:alcohol dehydrogenase [Arthrobacter crystallopoietes BAB-32]|uniref:Alcohol dehydrogenase n=1 Tax=Arthrobacter crystallopoietes BAB-32 TaxID=1246476 RepID=N1V130_9MICC|nr:alcohol dehydrogenase catalytic domain-containing protein [Arthrobacter crystallopoietes]EMY35045.1 alcohol dehydrogenase [Arthrobacter crystallopoietes BAB-32]
MAASEGSRALTRLYPTTRALARTSTEPAGVGLIDHPLRQPAPDEVELQVSLCGLSGSDAVVFDADPAFAWVRPGTVLGHEAVGVVGTTGLLVPEAVTPGLRVVPVSALHCGRCSQCIGGRTEQCRHRVTLGLGRHGTAAARAVLPWHCLVPLPADLPDTTAVLTEPASVAWRATVDVAQTSPGERVAVSTTRAVGLLAALIAKSRGAEVTMVGRPGPGLEAKERLAADLGLETATDPAPESFDTWIEATGSGKQLATATESLRPGGKLVLVAMYASGTPETISMPVGKELTILASYSSARPDFEHAIRFLTTLPALGSRLVTVYPMEQAVEALRRTARPSGANAEPLIKAAIRPVP